MYIRIGLVESRNWVWTERVTWRMPKTHVYHHVGFSVNPCRHHQANVCSARKLCDRERCAALKGTAVTALVTVPHLESHVCLHGTSWRTEGCMVPLMRMRVSEGPWLGTLRIQSLLPSPSGCATSGEPPASLSPVCRYQYLPLQDLWEDEEEDLQST